MEKLRSILKWIATDGLLHMLVCYAIMLALTPVVGVWWATAATFVAAVGKEAIDGMKGATAGAIMHDFICDAVGLLLADCTIFVWWLCNL